MKRGKKLLVVAFVGLLMTVGLVACNANCSGAGDCTVRADEKSAIRCYDWSCGVSEAGDICDC
ncbi:hypothetical protein AGMMS49579_00480 [Spirochaetia bacterium]|nr:hypothetical protein AGMMS49579_00410 [Spirochaetia bacterium]GHV49296.1 hypothetical protein AGMMS49579_00480 [Spirochaetia bacterium]